MPAFSVISLRSRAIKSSAEGRVTPVWQRKTGGVSQEGPFARREGVPASPFNLRSIARFQQRDALTRFLACGCQTPVKRHERSICNLADCKQIAIAKRFRRRQAGNRTGCRTEGHVKFKRILPDFDSRILKPPVVHLPGFADRRSEERR